MQSIGTPFLAALVKSMRGAMEATLVFITTGIGTPPLRAHSMASWQENGIKDAFEYDLEGTPCRLVYKGEALIISEGLYKRFPRETGFEGYVGVPLRNSLGSVVGHFAVFSEKPLVKPSEAAAIVQLFAMRAEAELQRIEHEREREAMIASLSQATRRLANRHSALRQTNEAKTTLLGMMAHDLRNPLSVILSRSEFIDGLLDKAGVSTEHSQKARESCSSIVLTVERMDRLIASCLSQAKSDAATIKLESQEFPIARAIELAVALSAVAANAKSISIRIEYDKVKFLRGDEDRIIEAMDNLISNAIKYSHSGHSVTVGSRDLTGATEIFVRDQGLGLTEEDCGLAFRQFQRLSAKPTAGESSTGLGLSIVKTIAEAHGGTAGVKSDGQGKGATFTITLPRQ